MRTRRIVTALIAPVLLLSLATPAQATASLRPVITHMTPNYGDTAGWTLVTIYGKNLSHVSRVRFGNIVVTKAIRNVSSTEVQVRTPRHPYGSYYVLVRTPNGVSGPMQKFEFYPRPEVTSLSSRVGPSSDGQNFTITGKFFEDVTAVWFGGVKATSFGARGTEIDVTSPRHRTGLFDVFVVTRIGASAAVSADQYRFVPPDPRKWTSPQAIDPAQGGVRSLACPTRSFCALGDDQGRIATFDRTRWSMAPIQIDGGMAQVYCYSAQRCFAWSLSKWGVYTFDGHSWTSTPAPNSPRLEYGLTCVSTEWCRALDMFGHEYTYDGTTWTATGQQIGAGILALTCSSTTSCMAVDGYGKTYDFIDGRWSTDQDLGFWPDAASCSASGYCMTMTAKRGSVAIYDGAWSELDAAPFNLNGTIDCVRANFCAAVDDNGNAWTFDGSTRTWTGPQPLDLPATSDYFVACSGERACVVANREGYARTVDNATLGDVEAADPAQGDIVSIKCPAVNNCTILDAHGNTIRQTAAGWGPVTATPLQNLDGRARSISCPTTDFCAAVSADEAAIFRDDAWQPPTPLPDSSVDAISCASPSFCVAVTQDGRALTFDGSAWSAAAATKHPMTAVSCTAVGECMVMTSSRYAAKLHDDVWTPSAPLTGADDVLTSMACTSLGHCLFGTYAGNVVHYASKVVAVDHQVVWRDISGIACSSSSSCDLVGDGMTAHYNGVYWTAPVSSDLYALSCTAASTCVGADVLGDVETSTLN